MSVLEIGKIDFIGLDDETGYVSLGISDHLEWSNEAHLDLLREKIDAYVVFIEEGQIYETYPEAKGRSFEIALILRFPPTAEAEAGLAKIKQALDEDGYLLTWETIGDSRDN